MSDSQYEEFHRMYGKKIDEMKVKGQEIESMISDYSKKIDKKQNTAQIEIGIQKKIDDFKKFQKNFDSAYDNNHVPSSLSSEVCERRQREIAKYKNEIKKLEDKFSALQNRKYEFKTDKLDDVDYNQKYKGYHTDQLLLERDNNLKNQNEQLEDITKNVKKGTTLAKNINKELENQNVQLESLGSEIDKLDSGMKRTMKKFDKYIQETSICCYLILIFLLVAALIVEFVLL